MTKGALRFLLALVSVPFIWYGVLTVRGAATCMRGEDCLGPFAEYVFAGIPALAVGYGLIVSAVALVISPRKRTRLVVTLALVGVGAIVVMTGLLWSR